MVVGCRGLVTCLQQYIAQFLDLQGFTVTKTLNCGYQKRIQNGILNLRNLVLLGFVFGFD